MCQFFGPPCVCRMWHNNTVLYNLVRRSLVI